MGVLLGSPLSGEAIGLAPMAFLFVRGIMLSGRLVNDHQIKSQGEEVVEAMNQSRG